MRKLRLPVGAVPTFAAVHCSLAAEATRITVRADRPGPTINRNLYGHFAEHLGRCIYEGIWVGEDSAIPNTRGTKSMMGGRVVVGGKGSTTAAGTHVPCIVRWPAVITAPRVSQDLVDSTDILPTICEAAGVDIPTEMTIDGRSFLAQLRGEKGSPREWVYCWYSLRGEPLRECAFDQRFKLYRTGEFYDLIHDCDEQQPLHVADLKYAEALAAAKRLQAALDQYSDARPAHLPRRDVAGKSADPAEKKARKNTKKAKSQE
jgi:arylsulfatase A